MRSAALLALLLMAALWAGVGCDRNVAPFDPAEEPQQPDLSRIFPAPEQPMPAGGAGPAGAAGEPTRAATAGRPGAAVRGTVHVAGEVAPSSASVLFVIARPAGAAGGPPLAVVRVSTPRFPLDFEIGPADVMIPSMRFEGAIELTARLDVDGNASTKSDDDRSTPAALAVVPGDVGVALRLE